MEVAAILQTFYTVADSFYAEYGKFMESQFSCDLAMWLGERFLAF